MQADGSSAAVVVKLDLQLPSMFVIEKQREAYPIRGIHVLTRSIDFIIIPLLFFWLGRLRPASYY